MDGNYQILDLSDPFFASVIQEEAVLRRSQPVDGLDLSLDRLLGRLQRQLVAGGLEHGCSLLQLGTIACFLYTRKSKSELLCQLLSSVRTKLLTLR